MKKIVLWPAAGALARIKKNNANVTDSEEIQKDFYYVREKKRMARQG